MAKNSNQAPKHLSREAKAWWTAILHEFNVDDAPGLLLLQTAMEAFDRMRDAQDAIKQHGMVFTDRYGQCRPNPACGVEKDARGQMLTALKSLNLDLEPLRGGPGRPPGR